MVKTLCQTLESKFITRVSGVHRDFPYRETGYLPDMETLAISGIFPPYVWEIFPVKAKGNTCHFDVVIQIDNMVIVFS